MTSTPDTPTTIAVDQAADTGKERRVGVTQGRVIRSEWIKFRSVRSTTISLIAAFVVAVGFGVLFSSFAGSAGAEGAGPGGPPGRGPGFSDPVSLAMAGFDLALLIVGVLGALTVTSEYSSGLIRATISAVPKRTPVLIAKVVVFTAAVGVVMALASLTAFFLSTAVYSGDLPTPSITDEGVLRSVLGTAAYTTAAGLIGLALGFLLRSTAGSVGVLIAFLLIAPGLAGLLPGAWGDTLPMYLPSNAGAAFTSIQSNPSLLDWPVGAAVLAAWVVGLFVVARAGLTYRDV